MTSAFHSWSDFWQMGGYAFYVWLAVAVTALSLLVVVWHACWLTYSVKWRASAGCRRRVKKERRCESAS